MDGILKRSTIKPRWPEGRDDEKKSPKMKGDRVEAMGNHGFRKSSLAGHEASSFREKVYAN